MSLEEILRHPPAELSVERRSAYPRTGYLAAGRTVCIQFGRRFPLERRADAHPPYREDRARQTRQHRASRPGPCPVPPDWSKIGYGSNFTVQRTGEVG